MLVPYENEQLYDDSFDPDIDLRKYITHQQHQESIFQYIFLKMRILHSAYYMPLFTDINKI